MSDVLQYFSGLLDDIGMIAWVRDNETLLWWMGALSVLTFLGTLAAVPFIVARIPADYFMREKHGSGWGFGQHKGLGMLGVVLKNVLGIILIVAGLAMLVLPGQGVLTILLGLSLMNFPGKFALERRIARQPAVLETINWMRVKANRPPLKFPTPPDQ
jgi:hypothetical protein